jgi:hypothetical protein
LFQIKKTDEQPQGAEGDGSDSESDYSDVGSPFDHIAVYKQMLELMKPGESVAKSLRRLGESITTVSILTSSSPFIFFIFFYFMTCLML